jgi:hypothetical protein
MLNHEEPTHTIEIDPRWVNYILPCILLLIALFAVVGFTITPQVNNGKGKDVMSWQDWEIMKKRSIFRDELAHIKAQADTLSSVITAVPDPVKIQLVTDNVLIELSNIQSSALIGAKQSMTDATRVIRGWSMGTASRDEARQALDGAIFEIRRAENPGIPTQTPIPTITPTPTQTPLPTQTITPEPTKKK